MKPKLILCLALVLSFALTGCATKTFVVTADKQQLMETHRVVAEVTCVEATPIHYTTFRDRHLRMLAVPPRTRWSATFKVNQVVKGDFSEGTITLTEARDAESALSRFFFEAGQDYSVGFDPTSHHSFERLTFCATRSQHPTKSDHFQALKAALEYTFKGFDGYELPNSQYVLDAGEFTPALVTEFRGRDPAVVSHAVKRSAMFSLWHASIKSMTDDRARVYVHFYQFPESSGGYILELHRDKRGWIVDSEKISQTGL